MKLKLFSILAVVAAISSACTSLNSGDSFNQTIDGVEYNFEVIVSKMNFVRLSPVSSPALLTGKLVLPASTQYEGVKYVVTQIGERAFKNYAGITAVTLPSTLSQIEKEAFAGCTALQEINVPQPLSVIGDYAFDGCKSLKAFSLKASISELGIGAFRGCESIKELEFTPTFSAIPDELCLGCTSLKAINLPSTIMSVGESAFEDCLSAATISIDSSLQTIGANAFAGCTSVESIVCMTPTPPTCTANTFTGINTLIPVTVPMANVEQYYAAEGWNRFANIIGK